MQAIDWVAREVAEGLEAGRKPLLAEKWGRLHIADVNLSGKADRIDVLPDGSLAIIDYKNGKPPSGKQVAAGRSEEHTSELQSLMRISYAVFCLNKTNTNKT